MNKIIFSLIAVFILGSCSSKFTLVKRKYSIGYYVSASKKAPAVKERDAKIHLVNHKNGQEDATTVQIVKAKKESKTVQTVAESKTQAKEMAIKTFTQAQKTPNADKLIASKNKHFSAQTKREFKSLKTKIGTLSKSGSEPDAKAIVTIILCISIPPLAVYLFKKNMDTNFWVDLILSLLFWLPGIIFAFLVCFAGVSL